MSKSFFFLQRRVADLHQITSIGSTDITDMWEPLEEGLLPYENDYTLLYANYLLLIYIIRI